MKCIPSLLPNFQPRGLAATWTAVFLLLCLRQEVFGRNISQFVHKSWDAKSGAPPNISAITQSSDGYLWLASSNGLYRFDGIEFERFEPPGETPLAGPVYSLLSTETGDVWVGSAVSGVGVVRNGEKRNYTPADGFPDGAVLCITQARDGLIWAATQSGLARFDGKHWRRLGLESGLEGAPISLFEDSRRNLWAATADAIFELPKGASKFHKALSKTAWVMHMVESADGAIWMAETARAVRRLYPAGGPRIDYGSQRILFDHENSLWITTLGDGLRRVPRTDELPAAKVEKSDQTLDSFTAKDGLTSDYVLSIYQDREGNIFVGTSGGLDRFTKGAIVPAPVPGKFSRSTIAAGEDGSVWLGCLSRDLGMVKDNKWYLKINEFPVFSSASDRKGGTWWSTSDAIWHETGDAFERVKFPPAYRLNAQPTRVAVDADGAAWVSGTFGILRLSNKDWQAIDLPPGFTGKNPSLAYADPAGRLWFGYRENTILVFEGSSSRILDAKNGLRIGVVAAVLNNGSNTWIGGSNGLQIYDGKHIREVRPMGGESWGSVSGIVETNGSLWLNASDGLIQIKPAALSSLKQGGSTADYTRFDAFDGLPGATQQSQPYPTLVRAHDGKLWFGASKGPGWIDPDDLPKNRLAPAVSIRSVIANRKQYTSLTGLRLPALTRDLEIRYTALSFTIPERVRFRYKLEGSDSSWQDAGTRRSAFYTNLAPGHYRFLLKACNNDGVWNEAGGSIVFSIDPAFYQTMWFRATSFLAGALLLWFLYRLRLKQATAQMHSRMEGQVVERERIARELHDTLLQSFQALMLRLQIVDDLLPEGKAKQQLELSLERADAAIAEGRRAVYGLRSSTTERSNLPQALRIFAAELFVEGGPLFDMIVEGHPRPLHPVPGDEVYRIACECLRNAHQHARAARVEAEITYGERIFRLRVRDDGQGIPAGFLESGRSGHFGLKGMRERAKQSGATLEIWSAPGAGTEIDFKVPGAVAYAEK